MIFSYLFQKIKYNTHYTCSIVTTPKYHYHSLINLLDITVTFKGYTLTIIVTEKSIWLGKFLDFLSHTPKKYKASVIISLTDRNIWVLLSNKKPHENNYNIIRGTLLKNNYHLHFINRTIHKRNLQLHYWKIVINSKVKQNYISDQILP